MRKITRYVLTELLLVFVVTLAGITLLLIFAALLREGIREGLGFASLLRLIPYAVPVALQPSLPATILIAACTVYGRMSADNEIVAVKSLGISPLAVIIPGLFLGFVISLVGVWINDIAPSWGRIGIARIGFESIEEIVYRMLRRQKYYSVNGLSIHVQDVRDKLLIEPHVSINSGSELISITARTAQLESDLQNGEFCILLSDGIVEYGDDFVFNFRNETHRQVISLPNVTRKGGLGDSPSLVPLRKIDAEIISQKKRKARSERLAATTAAYQLLVGDFGTLSDSTTWHPLLHEMDASGNRLHRLQLEPHRRWATGLSCFCFVLVGAPLAIQRRTRNFFTTFAACFLPILLIYYPLLAFAIDRAKDGAVPPYTVWLGNAVMVVIGFFLLRRVIRY